MALSELEKRYIELFKTSCFAFDRASMHIQYILLTENFKLRNELDFQIIPDLLIALSEQNTEESQTVAQWLIAPERFEPNQPYSLEYSIPAALILKSNKSPEQFERLLTWNVTKALFIPSHKDLLNKFVQGIIDSDETTVRLLLQHFPTLSGLTINKETSPLALALSLDTINKSIVQALLTAGANPNGDIAPEAENYNDTKIETPTHRPLHQAIIRGNLTITRMLIQAKNIDLEQLDGFEINRPQPPNMQRLSTFLIYQTKTNWGPEKLTPALLAAKCKFTEALHLLAEKGIELPKNKNKRKNFFEENNEAQNSRQAAVHSSQSAPAPQGTALKSTSDPLSVRYIR